MTPGLELPGPSAQWCAGLGLKRAMVGRALSSQRWKRQRDRGQVREALREHVRGQKGLPQMGHFRVDISIDSNLCSSCSQRSQGKPMV